MYRRSERKRTQTDRTNSGIASAAAKKAKHQHSDVAIKTDKSTKLWKEDKTIHTPKLCTMFTKHVDKMLNNREKIKIFIPHCGKAVEIKWLWDKGHEVVGVNCGEKALKECFEDNKIGYSIVKIPAVKGNYIKVMMEEYGCIAAIFISSAQPLKVDLEQFGIIVVLLLPPIWPNRKSM
ncbi:TPMT [Mytilus edulis]|uniref:TPMT n=1 Tax=Mytilus edulis TaxID=6550 RepID=A0A8S3R0L4_MYTED|nr:TPMT [Mytilus edulis]